MANLSTGVFRRYWAPPRRKKFAVAAVTVSQALTGVVATATIGTTVSTVSQFLVGVSTTAIIGTAIPTITLVGASPQAFDTAHNDTANTITGSGLTLTKTSSNASSSSTFAANSVLSGRYYYEVNLSFTTAAEAGIGISTQNSIYQSTYIGNTSAQLGFFADGSVWNGNGNVATYAAATSGQTVCLAIDLASHLIWYRVAGGNWNNSGVADPTTGVGGFTMPAATYASAVVPAVTLYNVGDVALAHFAASSWTFTAPSGFQAFSGFAGVSAIARTATSTVSTVSISLTGVATTATTGTTVSTVSTSLTGVATTATTGTTVSTASKTPTGVATTATTGTTVSTVTKTLTGVATTATTGTSVPTVSISLTGVATTATTGTTVSTATKSLTGVATTATTGTTVSTVSISLGGVVATATPGTAVASSNSTQTASPTGVATTLSVGLLALSVSKTFTGVATTSALGTATRSLSQPISGVSITALAGAPSVGGTFSSVGAATGGSSANALSPAISASSGGAADAPYHPQSLPIRYSKKQLRLLRQRKKQLLRSDALPAASPRGAEPTAAIPLATFGLSAFLAKQESDRFAEQLTLLAMQDDQDADDEAAIIALLLAA